MASVRLKSSNDIMRASITEKLTEALTASGTVSNKHRLRVHAVLEAEMAPYLACLLDAARSLEMDMLPHRLAYALRAVGVGNVAQLKALCWQDLSRYLDTDRAVRESRDVLRSNLSVILPARLGGISRSYIPFRPVTATDGFDEIHFSFHNPDITTLAQVADLMHHPDQLEALLVRTRKSAVRRAAVISHEQKDGGDRIRTRPDTAPIGKHFVSVAVLMKNVRRDLKALGLSR